MKKRILTIFIAAILLFSFLPLDGFSNDHAECDAHHHCVIVCSIHCHPVALSSQYQIPLVSASTSLIPASHFSYQSPILETLLRPPIFA